MYKLGGKKLGSSPAEGALGVWVDGQLTRSPQRALAAKGPAVSWVHQAQHRPPVGAGDRPAPHCTGVAPPPALGAALGASGHEGHQAIGACPGEGGQDGEGSRGQT